MRLRVNDSVKDDFIDFHKDPKIKDNFERAGMDIQQFWSEQIPTFPSLAVMAMHVLVPFTVVW